MEGRFKLNLVEAAVKDFTLIQDVVKDKKTAAKSLRARCREMPSLIESMGLVPALSFCFAKAGMNTYSEVFRTVTQRPRGLNINKEGAVGMEGTTEEGYAIYLYFILKTIKSLNIIMEDDVEKPVEALKKILGKERSTAALIKPYILQLKKLAEAVFEE